MPIHQLNWIDFVVITLVLRAGYVGFKTGLWAELFRVAGLIAALLVAATYYLQASDWLLTYVPAAGLVTEVAVFLAIACGVYLVVSVLRRGLLKLFKKAHPTPMERAGGTLLGAARGVAVAGLLLLLAYASPLEYVRISIADRSWSGWTLMKHTAQGVAELAKWSHLGSTDHLPFLSCAWDESHKTF